MSRLLLMAAMAVVVGACGGMPGGNGGGSAGGGSAGGGSAGGGSSGGGTSTAGGGTSSSGGGSAGGGGVRRIEAVTCGPSMVNVEVGARTGINAFAQFDDGTSAEISGTATWKVSNGALASITVDDAAANEVSLRGLAMGSTTFTAETGSFVSAPCTVTVQLPGTMTPDGGPAPALEARAVWVTRFAYNTEAEVKAIIGRAAASGFNIVYFQVRGNGDAYYKSTLSPWAKKLTGTLGKDPGWDPLQVAITEAHAKGLELHAYWNVFAGWTVPSGCASAGTCTCDPIQGQADSCTLPEQVADGGVQHFLRLHPEAMAVTQNGKNVDSEYYWMSAGDPQVRAYVVASAEEVAKNYAIDGLHLDRVRYPGTGYSYDPASNAAYAALAEPKPTRADWQRQNVTTAVGQIYDALKKHRPKAPLSASVWGIYKPLPGCNTSQGFGNYYQDSLAWMQQGKIDAINPMIYWDIGTGCTDWAKLLDGFMAGAAGRHVIAGMHGLDQSKPRPERIAARIAYARAKGAAGTTLFASTYLDQAPADGGFTTMWQTFRAPGGPYVTDAGVPPMPWK